HRLGAAWGIVGLREESAEQGLHAENRQRPLGHIQGPDLFGFAEAGHGVRVAAPESDVAEALPLLAVGEIKKWCGAGLLNVDAGRAVVDRDERVRSRVLQRLNKDAVDHAEDRAV